MKLPPMTRLEKKVFELYCELNPSDAYAMGLREYAGKVMILSSENLSNAINRINELRKLCGPKDTLVRKFLDSIEVSMEFEEPGVGVAQVTQAISVHLIKEGLKAAHLEPLTRSLAESLDAWLRFLEGREYTVAVKILAQYQALGALEVINMLEREAKEPALLESVGKLRKKVDEFRSAYQVPGFTLGEFEEVEKIMLDKGADLGREKFYPRALKFGFDYAESWKELERRALNWLDQDLPKFLVATRKLSKRLNCDDEPEAVYARLKARPGVSGKQALDTTKRIRKIIQPLIAESIVGINPGYRVSVVETPPYLAPILPTAAAQGFDSLTTKPYQFYYLTIDPKRAPPEGFADLVNTLIHEEYGHCVHFSNSATAYAARPTITEILSSPNSGTSAEGLAFQRELEFLNLLYRIRKKKPSARTIAERKFLLMLEEFGGFEQFLEELEFATYRFRVVRFLRVIGDTRINSGKQNLIEFLRWAERKTGLSRRTVFYQLFPAHEGIFPGYATCYAVVGQDIRSVQRPIPNNPKKLVKFNAYASSMGYPPRSIYINRLRTFARKLAGRKR